MTMDPKIGNCNKAKEHKSSRQKGGRSRHRKKVKFVLPPKQLQPISIKQGPTTNFRENENQLRFLENSARKIQIQFRQSVANKSGTKGPHLEEHNDLDTESVVGDLSQEEPEEMDPERVARIITHVFVLLYSVCTMTKRWIVKCFNDCTGNLKRSYRKNNQRGDKDDEDLEGANPDEIAVDGDPNHLQGQPQTGPTTGGPTAPTPTPGGMESMMATQAASTVTGGVSSGVSAGIAAGTIATSTATSAAAAVGVAATTTQLATAAVVTTSVAIASSVMATALPTTELPFSIISTCGIERPTFRRDKLMISFEGFDRKLDDREHELIESMLVDSYNLVTRGSSQNVLGCVDEYLREMQNATLMTQAFVPSSEEDRTPALVFTFDTWVICDGCPEINPLFGRASQGSMIPTNRSLQESKVDVESKVGMGVEINLDLLEAHLKNLVRGVVELSGLGELPESFLPTKVRALSASSSENSQSDRDKGGALAAVNTSEILLSIPIGFDETTTVDGNK